MSQNLRPKTYPPPRKEVGRGPAPWYYAKARRPRTIPTQSTPAHPLRLPCSAAPTSQTLPKTTAGCMHFIERETVFGPPMSTVACWRGRGRPLAVFLAGYVPPSHFLSSHISRIPLNTSPSPSLPNFSSFFAALYSPTHPLSSLT